jgi:DNA-binding transcriptional MerR regulator
MDEEYKFREDLPFWYHQVLGTTMHSNFAIRRIKDAINLKDPEKQNKELNIALEILTKHQDDLKEHHKEVFEEIKRLREKCGEPTNIKKDLYIG